MVILVVEPQGVVGCVAGEDLPLQRVERLAGHVQRLGLRFLGAAGSQGGRDEKKEGHGEGEPLHRPRL